MHWTLPESNLTTTKPTASVSTSTFPLGQSQSPAVVLRPEVEAPHGRHLDRSFDDAIDCDVQLEHMIPSHSVGPDEPHDGTPER